MAQISQREAAIINELRAAGYSYRQIATMTGVSYSKVRYHLCETYRAAVMSASLRRRRSIRIAVTARELDALRAAAQERAISVDALATEMVRAALAGAARPPL